MSPKVNFGFEWPRVNVFLCAGIGHCYYLSVKLEVHHVSSLDQVNLMHGTAGH